MRNLKDPRQIPLFDPWAQVFAPRLYEKLRGGWQGLFHDVLLELMPARELAEQFHPVLGRPTKELYSVAGLVFVKECNDWTEEEAVEAYCFRSDVQYALNVSGEQAEISLRTLQRYLRVFRERELAAQVFDDVTEALVAHLELDVRHQRADSTHVYSNMAMIGRTTLMARALQRLLTQVLRHHRERYEALPEDLRARYEKKSGSSCFGWQPKESSAEQRRQARQQVAEDMHFVLAFYDAEAAITNKDTYKQLRRVFEEHCAVIEDTVTVRPKSDSRALQSLSDPDATYDGHKGRGYQAQLCQTCSEHNEVQLITDIMPQTAADADSEALPEMVQRLEDKHRKPKELLADTAYGSDDNVQYCADNGVELLAPVKRRHDGNENALTALDFDIDQTSRETRRCPAGHTPCATAYSQKRDEGYALFERATCEACPHFGRCLVYKHRQYYRLKYSNKTLRLEARRRAQERPAFKQRYRLRAGIEGLMSALKRGHGFGRLRVRGQPAVDMALYLKAAGHNLLQAARAIRKRSKTRPKPRQTGQKRLSHQLSRLWLGLQRVAQTIVNAQRSAPQAQDRKPRSSFLRHQTLMAG
jgi:hypothetical protein